MILFFMPGSFISATRHRNAAAGGGIQSANIRNESVDVSLCNAGRAIVKLIEKVIIAALAHHVLGHFSSRPIMFGITNSHKTQAIQDSIAKSPSAIVIVYLRLTSALTGGLIPRAINCADHLSIATSLPRPVQRLVRHFIVKLL
jgi:hypothetical protein